MTTDSKNETPKPVGSGHLVRLLEEAAKEQRGCADQCIDAKKAKALFLKNAETFTAAAKELTELRGLNKAAQRLNEIVGGVRNERWASDGRRLKDTPEWVAFCVALPRGLRPTNKMSHTARKLYGYDYTQN